MKKTNKDIGWVVLLLYSAVIGWFALTFIDLPLLVLAIPYLALLAAALYSYNSIEVEDGGNPDHRQVRDRITGGNKK